MKRIEISRISYLLNAEIQSLINCSNGSVEFHNNLRKSLCKMAAVFGCVGKTRYKVNNKRRMDVVWIDACDNIKAAFELDGGNRKRYRKRLLDITSNNKIWIYYGNSNKLQEMIKKNVSNKSIFLLNLGNIRKKVRSNIQ